MLLGTVPTPLFSWIKVMGTSPTREKEEREGTRSEKVISQPCLLPQCPDTSVSQVTCFLLISEHFSTLNQ